MKKHSRMWIAACVGLTLASAGASHGQMVVYDPAAVTQLIQQVTQAKAQLDQMQQMNSGLNKLTSMGDVASLLNNQQIRNALPKSFSSVESSLSSGGGGAYGSQYTSSNQSYVSPGNDFYAQELGRQQGVNAGQMGLGQQMYDAATARMAGIEQLRHELQQSQDPKTTLDLQARIQLEMAFMTIDVNRMQALQMLQQAQVQVSQTREREELKRQSDLYRQQFPEIAAPGAQ